MGVVLSLSSDIVNYLFLGVIALPFEYGSISASSSSMMESC